MIKLQKAGMAAYIFSAQIMPDTPIFLSRDRRLGDPFIGSIRDIEKVVNEGLEEDDMISLENLGTFLFAEDYDIEILVSDHR